MKRLLGPWHITTPTSNRPAARRGTGTALRNNKSRSSRPSRLVFPAPRPRLTSLHPRSLAAGLPPTPARGRGGGGDGEEHAHQDGAQGQPRPPPRRRGGRSISPPLRLAARRRLAIRVWFLIACAGACRRRRGRSPTWKRAATFRFGAQPRSRKPLALFHPRAQTS